MKLYSNGVLLLSSGREPPSSDGLCVSSDATATAAVPISAAAAAATATAAAAAAAAAAMLSLYGGQSPGKLQHEMG